MFLSRVLFDWATQGSLLGASYAVFKKQYEDRIVEGNMQNATPAGKLFVLAVLSSFV